MRVFLKYSFLISLAGLFILLTIALPVCSHESQPENPGFTVELIHRDSPNSPFFNASESTSARFIKALQSSTNRVNHFNQIKDAGTLAQSPVIYYNGEYLMKIGIGTPASEMVATVESSGEHIWMPCLVCGLCGGNTNPRLFNHSSSTTFDTVLCGSSQCRAISGTSCGSRFSPTFCSYSCGNELICRGGDISIDTISLDSSSNTIIMLPNTTFICGSNFGATEFYGTAVVGLGPGPLSLTSRLYPFIDGRFSYCLVPYHSSQSSKIKFGGPDMALDPEALTTPLDLQDSDTQYIIKLEAITVAGNHSLDFSDNIFPQSAGNIIIDSGTRFTYLPGGYYHGLELVVKENIPMEPIDGALQELNLCYKTGRDLDAPIITMHFTGADLDLSPSNTFIRVTEDVVCFAFAPVPDNINTAVYGNIQQLNHVISYDLKQKFVSFKKTDCTMHN